MQINYNLCLPSFVVKANSTAWKKSLNYPIPPCDILRVMGFEAEPPEEEKMTSEERTEILEKLNEGVISIDEAQELLLKKTVKIK